MFLFDQNTPLNEINRYLSDKISFLERKELINQIEIAGEGNMNVVLRLRTQKRSFILKQSRPYVQKYPSLAAPIERIAVEHQFYTQMLNNSFFPKVLYYSTDDHLMLLEDLGQCESLTSLYKEASISESLFKTLLIALDKIHSCNISKDYPKNRGLRNLNHQHLFILPFKNDNNFSLDTIQKGLDELATPYKKNKGLKKQIERLGEHYLKQGNTMLHGDYYPGSWMMNRNQLYIIDPEFSFVGFKEFDLGVMAGHLLLATANTNYLERICKEYPTSINEDWVYSICGIEILRRLIGLAQLPLNRSLEEKQRLLSMAQNFVLG